MLNEMVSAKRKHIAFFGRCNVGKSSLVNRVTGQELCVVSPVLGTTTDPVKKAMELLPLGPVVIIDTPGFDDSGELGEMRVKKTKQILNKTDIAVLVTDAVTGLDETEEELLRIFDKKNIPYVIAFNKSDIKGVKHNKSGKNVIYLSAKTGENIEELKELIAGLLKNTGEERRLVSDLLKKGDTVVLVMPIDEAAPKGRIILPQQQTIRDILDSGATAVCCRDSELSKTLSQLSEKPGMVITDSQAFGKVSKIVPEDIALTSFSILFARYKGELLSLIEGAKTLSELKDDDRVLISEGCTHHRQCGDIGSVKLPGWICEYTNSKPLFSFSSGGDFPEDLHEFSLIIHCGGCMLTEREMQSRMEIAKGFGVPMVNYGIAIAKIKGILERSIAIFK